MMSLRSSACFRVTLFTSGSFSKNGDGGGESGIGISLGDTGGGMLGVEEAEIAS